MTGSLIIRGARVLTLDRSDTEWSQADIVISEGRISAVGPRAADGAAADRVIEGRGLLAMPGLINAHFHSPGNLLKGYLPSLPLELFMLYEVPPLANDTDTGRLAYIRTILGAIEMLSRGITAVHDDAYHVPTASPASVDPIMEAYRDAGIRATVAIDQPNVVEYEKHPFLAELLPAEVKQAMDRAPRQSAAELLEVYRHLTSRWHGAEGGRLKAAVSCSAPQRVTQPYFEGLSELSRRHDLPFNIHMLETRLQRVLGAEKYGRSLVAEVERLGFLDERVLAIHAIWVDDDDIEILARSGCTVAHNPVCNLRLGSGVMPYYKLRAAGVPMCLGSDEIASDDSLNMWFVAKTSALLQTVGNPEYREWPDGAEILAMATAGGAAAMRMGEQLGRIEAGCLADIVLLDLDTASFTPLNDLRRQLIYCEDGSSVRFTIVAGRVVFENGSPAGLDARAIRQEARSLMERHRATLGQAKEQAARLEPYYRRMYLRAASTDVGMSRWLTP